jgi:hypothetical protein
MKQNPRNEDIDLDVRHHIYTTFAKTTHSPTTWETAEHLGLTTSRVESSFKRLADSHQIALAPGSTSIWMAHPFSGVRTNYTVSVGAKKYWGN